MTKCDKVYKAIGLVHTVKCSTLVAGFMMKMIAIIICMAGFTQLTAPFCGVNWGPQ